MESPSRGATIDSSSFWRAVRRDPVHLPELALVRAVPLLSPRVHEWAAQHHTSSTDNRSSARRTVRKATHHASWAGVITGSSFYVGMAPALALIYSEQLLVILSIAAIFGHDPRSPARAPEILVIQSRYANVELAEEALRLAGAKRSPTVGLTKSGATSSVVRQALSMIGLQLRRLKSPLDVLLVPLEALSLLTPIIGIPVWAYVSGRQARRLGGAAIRFYEANAPGDVPPSIVALPPAPTDRARRRVVSALVAVGLLLAALAQLVPLGRISHLLPLAGRGLVEVGLLLTISRLVRMVRPIARGSSN
jgi:hypothetical protein